MKNFSKCYVALAALVLSVSGSAQTLPSSMNYQGRLTTAAGTNLQDGNYQVTFRIYTVATGGTASWTETKTIPVKRGVFATQLGLPAADGGTPFPAGLFSQRLWLGISVAGSAELVPRQELGAVPFALGVAGGSVVTSMLADSAVSSAKLASDVASLTKVSGGLMTFASQVFFVNAGLNLRGSLFMDKGDGAPYMLNMANGALRFAPATAGDWNWNRSLSMNQDGKFVARNSVYVDSHGWGHDATIDLAIGDSDTGLNWAGDGKLLFVCNANNLMELNDANLFTNVPVSAPEFRTRSSIRYKTNVRTLNGALSKVESLRGVSYDSKLNGEHQVGFIAEEVAKIVPQIVARDGRGRVESMDYSRLTALLVEAVKEQQQRADSERARAERLEQRVQRLELAVYKLNGMRAR